MITSSRYAKMTYHFPDEIQKNMAQPAKNAKGKNKSKSEAPKEVKWKSILDTVTLININSFYDEKELNAQTRDNPYVQSFMN
jgi:hypothetical protein